MKFNQLSWYILIGLLLFSIPTATSAILQDINPVFGFVSYVVEDLPVSPNIEGCTCGGTGKIFSGDKLFSKPCICTMNGGVCKCTHQGSLPPKPLELDLVPEPKVTQKSLDGDCDRSIKEMVEPALPYKRFKPMSRKEMWVLSSESCGPCRLLHKELERLKKRGWKVDFAGDLSSNDKFHIRVIDLDKFEGVPDFFFTKYDGTEGLNLPTTVVWEDYKLNRSKTTVGFMDVFAIDKLWGKKD